MQARFSSAANGQGVSDRLQPLAGFGPNPGALAAKFHVPNGLEEGAPLVVVLHGCTQTAAGYDYHSGWSRLADEAGFALLFPEQQRANNPNLCFNWFLPGDARRGSGEALSIRQMIETMVATHGLDRTRIFITGLSAGGAMASAMLASYPEVFAAPCPARATPVWVLGSSPVSARYAAERGLPYAFGAFLDPRHLMAALATYHQYFQPSRHLDRPTVILAWFAVIGESEQDARRQAASSEAWFIDTFLRGHNRPFPVAEVALAASHGPQEQAMLMMKRQACSVGTAGQA